MARIKTGEGKGHGKGKKYGKGDSGNPLGGKLHNPEKKKLKQLLKTEFSMTISMVTQSTLSELQEIVKDPTSPIDRVIMASALINGVRKGDVSQLVQLAEIVIGKPKEHVEHSVANAYEKLSNEQLDDKIKQLESLSTEALPLRDVTPETKKD